MHIVPHLLSKFVLTRASLKARSVLSISVPACYLNRQLYEICHTPFLLSYPNASNWTAINCWPSNSAVEVTLRPCTRKPKVWTQNNGNGYTYLEPWERVNCTYWQSWRAKSARKTTGGVFARLLWNAHVRAFCNVYPTCILRGILWGHATWRKSSKSVSDYPGSKLWPKPTELGASGFQQCSCPDAQGYTVHRRSSKCIGRWCGW